MLPEVGQPAPITLPPTPGIFTALDGPGFNVWAFYDYDHLTPKDVKWWRKGQIRYGVFIEASIPFIVMDIAGFAIFDAPFNALGEPNDRLRAFLEGDPAANMVTMVLSDWPAGTVRGIRTIRIGPDVVQRIKNAMFDQISIYHSTRDVDMAIQAILTKYTTDAIMPHAQMWRL